MAMTVSLVSIVSPVFPFLLILQFLCMVKCILFGTGNNSVNLAGVKNLLCTTHQVVYFGLFHFSQSLMVVSMYLAYCCSEFSNSIIQLPRTGPGESLMWV